MFYNPNSFTNRVTTSSRYLGSSLLSAMELEAKITRASKRLFYAIVIYMIYHAVVWSFECGPLVKSHGDRCVNVRVAEVEKNKKKQYPDPYFDSEPSLGEIVREPGTLPAGFMIVVSNTNVRRGPGMQYEPFEVLPKGTVVEPMTKEGRWIQVKQLDRDEEEWSGWIWDSMLSR